MRRFRSSPLTGTRTPGCASARRGSSTWALQRREDAGEKVGPIPVPPKYAPADFRKTAYWQARGKLDVPKERFVAYPDAGRETDPTAAAGLGGLGSRAAGAGAGHGDHRAGGRGLAGRPAGPAGRRAGGAPAVGGSVARRGRPGVRGEHGRVLPRAAHRSGPRRSARPPRNCGPGGPSRPGGAEGDGRERPAA